jgi:hypothetical protein
VTDGETLNLLRWVRLLKKPKVTSFGCIAPQLEDSKRYKPNGLYLNTGRNSIIVSCMRGFVEMGI